MPFAGTLKILRENIHGDSRNHIAIWSSREKAAPRFGHIPSDIGRKGGLHQTYVAGIESGKRNVTLKCVEKLAGALQVSTSALFLDSNDAELVPPPAAYVDILMVEDDRNDVDMAMRAFKQARIRNTVQVVHDGKEALDFLFCDGAFKKRKIEDRPQLVLLDLNLPKIGGMEVLPPHQGGRTHSFHSGGGVDRVPR